MHPKHFHPLPGKTSSVALGRPRARLLFYFAGFGFLSIVGFLYACNRVQATGSETPSPSQSKFVVTIPPIDAALPIDIQTATFALG